MRCGVVEFFLIVQPIVKIAATSVVEATQEDVYRHAIAVALHVPFLIDSVYCLEDEIDESQ